MTGPRVIPHVQARRIAKARSLPDVEHQQSKQSNQAGLNTNSSNSNPEVLDASCLQQLQLAGNVAQQNNYLQMSHQHFDYTDDWPEVEVTVHVLDCSGLNLACSTFDLDFLVILDWLDYQLVENEHFGYDTRNGRFHLLDSVLNDPDFFNPTVRVDNSVAVELIEGDSDRFPKIKRLLSTRDAEDDDELEAGHGGGPAGDVGVGGAGTGGARSGGSFGGMRMGTMHLGAAGAGGGAPSTGGTGRGTSSSSTCNAPRREVPWLSKVMRFKGTLVCMDIDAKWFPLDVIKLRIRLVSDFLKGTTSMGKKRRVKLIDPLLRVAYKTGKQSDNKWSRKISPHSWPSNAMTLGEMMVTGFGGCDCEDIAYQFDILLTRRWGRYWFDFLIQGLQVVSAAFSLYVPFNYDAGSDTLPNRLSITLTVILTLVAFTIERPSVIESLPYPTLHDNYERIMVAIVALVGIENVIVFQTCVGSFPKYYHDPFHNNAPLPDPPELCQVGFCGASTIDCLCFVSVVVAVLVVSVVLLFWGQFYRIREVLRVHRQLHEFDWVTFMRMLDHVKSMCNAFDGFDKKIWRRTFHEVGPVDAQMLRVRPDFVRRRERYTGTINQLSGGGRGGGSGPSPKITFPLGTSGGAAAESSAAAGDETPPRDHPHEDTSAGGTSKAAGGFFGDLEELVQAAAKSARKGTTHDTALRSKHVEWYYWNSPQVLHWGGLDIMPGDAIRVLSDMEEDAFRESATSGRKSAMCKVFGDAAVNYLSAASSSYNSVGRSGTKGARKPKDQHGAAVSSSQDVVVGAKPVRRRKSTGFATEKSSDVIIVNQEEDVFHADYTCIVEVRSLNHERLILCGTDALFPEEMRDLEDIVEAVSILPLSKFFAQFWLSWVLRRERKNFLSKCELQRAVKELAMIEDDGEYNKKKAALMKASRVSVISMEGASHPRFDSTASNLGLDENNPETQKVTLGDPHDPVYVLDVGTGEIGFYVFWRDCETEEVSSKVHPKWSYPSKQDFVRTFYKAGSGKREFADLLVKNFKLLDGDGNGTGTTPNAGGGGDGGGIGMMRRPSYNAFHGGSGESGAAPMAKQEAPPKPSTSSNPSNPKPKASGEHPPSAPGCVVDLTEDESPEDHSTSTNAGSSSDSAAETQHPPALTAGAASGTTTSTSRGTLTLPPVVLPRKSFGPAQPADTSTAPVDSAPALDASFTSTSGSSSFPQFGLLAPAGAGSSHQQRVRIYLGLTGKNRDYLLANPDEKEDFEKWLLQVTRVLRDEYRITARLNFLDFLSTRVGAKTEAAYELSATQWLLQNGDLDMDLVNVPRGPRDTRFAFLELKSCIESIFVDCPERNRLGFWREKYLYEFRDFSLEKEDLETLWLCAMEKTGFETPTTPKDRERVVAAVMQSLLDEPVFLRAMTRARLFQGTLSAGGGSCQVTCQPQAGRTEVVYGSIPFGNRTSYSGSEGMHGLCSSVWDKQASVVTPQMLQEWSLTVKQAIADNKIPCGIRGLFVGISAVYHAAAFCKCDNKILPKAEFLSRLEQTLELERLRTAQKDAVTTIQIPLQPVSPATSASTRGKNKGAPNGGAAADVEDQGLPLPHTTIGTTKATGTPLPEKELRNLSNLQLVHTFVSEVLHEQAFIVCKRNWFVAEAEYVATWSFGFWLTSMRQKSFRKQGSSFSECGGGGAGNALEVIRED